MARSHAMLHKPAEPAAGICCVGEFPLYYERFAPRGAAAYQRCKTGTRYWRAEAAKSVDGDWRVYVRVHGPRGTEHGWKGYSPDGARQAAAEVRAAVDGLTEDRPLVRAPWYATVKGEVQHYTLTRGEARWLALCLETQADEAEEQARVDSLALYDVPWLPEGVPA
jgi:hypothetical protein